MSDQRKTIDKDLYRAAYQLYAQRSEEKKLDRALLANKLSPAEAWREYVDL